MFKTALITGASGGIGAQTARLLAREGYRLALHFHQNREAAQRLAEELSAVTDVAAVQGDLTDSRQVSAVFEEAEQTLGPVSLLVNNAGVARQKLLADVTDGEWDEMLAANLSSVFYCCRRAIPAMVREKAGKIINISSIWGICGASCEAPYSAAKAGVIGLTRSLAKELGPSGIQVNCIAPGVIDTPMNRALTDADKSALCEETPLGRMGAPYDIAAAVLYLASPAGDFVTGQVISPNGGMVI